MHAIDELKGGTHMRRFGFGLLVASGIALAQPLPAFAQGAAAVTELRYGVDPQRCVDVDRANRGRAVAFPRHDRDRGFVRCDRS